MTTYEPQDAGLVCIGCNRHPSEIESVVMSAREAEMEPWRYVMAEEGTLNPTNGHFACDECYIRMGMPAGPPGNRWVAP